MSERNSLHLAIRFALAWIVFLLAPASAHAGLSLAAGGGVIARAENPEKFAPTTWLSVRLPLSDSWSAVANVGYQQISTWYGTTYARPLPLPPWPPPTGAWTQLTETYVPAGIGFRLTMARPEPRHTRVFVECAATVSRARLERVSTMYDFWGQAVRSTESAGYWLPGVDLSAGFRHPVSDSFGFEWGLRWALRETPRGAEAERLMGYQHRSASMLSLEAAMTYGP